MRKLRTTTQFKHDLKKAGKRAKNPDKLRSVITKLVAGEQLDRLNVLHRLSSDRSFWFGMKMRSQ